MHFRSYNVTNILVQNHLGLLIFCVFAFSAPPFFGGETLHEGLDGGLVLTIH